ncbi:Protein kinase domain-containing protein [Mycena chlorophos]|uniref:Protein kinase domain-containing protein n=1 Tax=Mycena chlorophos TaxID=658473 RepID=A0A8H6S513_MYCCL|nr:Protein kinase domain-containing protein [Mycena chlorophos]
MGEKFSLVSEVGIYNEDESFVCSRLLFESNDHYYICDTPDRSVATLQLPQLFASSVQIPVTVYRARIPTDFEVTGADSDSQGSCFIKRVRPFDYDAETDSNTTLYADAQLRELKVLELLKKHPHPNICRYYGYLPTADGQYVGGICLQRLECTLQEAMERGDHFPATFLEPIGAALEHLHSLGYAHNDINPRNVMLSEAGEPVLVDFDSAVKLGDKLEKGKTPEWEYEGEISSTSNDLSALHQLCQYLAKGMV